jgi:muramoyltetrapeptide carboxypeptidase
VLSPAAITRPRALPAGARLGVFTPSFPGPALYPERFARGLRALEEMGFEVLSPPAASGLAGYASGSAVDRARALMALFIDDRVDGIICSLGGYNSNAILPYLDYETIARHPKVFAGYSDATALLVGLLAKASLVTIHGPAVLSEWAEFPAPLAYTADSFLAVTRGTTPYTYRTPQAWTNEFLAWGTSDTRARAMTPHEGWRTIVNGHATGRLLGGNLETLNMLVGTPFLPQIGDTLLFIEATDAEAYLPRLERALVHLELAGILRDVRGLLVARCPDARPERGVTLEDLLRDLGERLGVPVVADLDFGHTDPKMTLPLGVEAELDASGDAPARLTLLTSAVQAASTP